MEKVQSLAEFLGVSDPRPAADIPCGPAINDALDISDPIKFCQAVVGSREFRQYIMNGVVLGDIPQAVVGRIMDHAWGKAVDRLEVKDVTVAPEQLTAENLEDRAARLAEMAKLMRRAEQFDEPLGLDSIH